MKTIAACDTVAVDESRSEHVTRRKGWSPEKERRREYDIIITWIRERRKFAFKTLNVSAQVQGPHIDNYDDDDERNHNLPAVVFMLSDFLNLGALQIPASAAQV